MFSGQNGLLFVVVVTMWYLAFWCGRVFGSLGLAWFGLVWSFLKREGRKKVHELTGENVGKPGKNMTKFIRKTLFKRQSEMTDSRASLSAVQRERGSEAQELGCGVEKGLYISLAH